MGGWRGGGADVGNHAVDEEQGARVVGGGGRGGVCVCGGGGLMLGIMLWTRYRVLWCWEGEEEVGGGVEGGGADVGNHAVDEEQGARVVGGGGRGGVCVWGGG